MYIFVVIFCNILKHFLQRFGTPGGCIHQHFWSTGAFTDTTPFLSSSSMAEAVCGAACLAIQAGFALAVLSSNTNLQHFCHVAFRCCSHAFATLCLKSYSPRENHSSARKCASAATDKVSSRGCGAAGVVPRMCPLSKAVAKVV